MTSITLCNYKQHYQQELSQLYYDAITKLAPAYYNQQQIKLWADYPRKYPEEFAELLMQGNVIMALNNKGTVIGFGQLNPQSYVSLLYVKPQYHRLGVASTIYKHLEQLAYITHQTTLSVTASKLSQPLFEKLGFELIDTEIVIRTDIQFERYNMVKLL
ncbi:MULTISPECIES: GNAT family N-acetyltransferase [unclassified Photobacterium]|uniref:GNAT family N-acetyltransferase n=1 Tax=unclassified Photobacterium TaxID=2628852 RepID=UPI001EDD872F|nr:MULTISPECIES: GNAT family N-acetyltransferase [unclassified Photobacterium]MCG3864677.1 GNAT family N-acetyltransferase [Photobacterium sp. Ph6]MCG3876801.1 GNAT family N-acetyltransferase [Photobacterium sp. Ph5]